jgi:hypothetical protein
MWSRCTNTGIIVIMRLLSLDFDPGYDDATRASFGDDDSVFDYDAVIWDPAGSLSQYISSYGAYYQGLPSLSDHASVQIVSDVRRRKREFVEFLHAGKALVVIVRPPQECYVDTGERTHSGTGRNRVTTTHVTKCDLWSALPISGVTLERASGSRVALVGDGAIVDLLRSYRKFLSYDAVMTTARGSTFAKVQGTERVLGTLVQTKGGGHLLLLPAMDWLEEAGDGDQDADWADEAPPFQADLLAALGQISTSGGIVRPTWAERFSTEKQRELRAAIVSQQTRIEAARAKLTRLQQQKEQADAPDQLFLGSGRALEIQVAAVLELLGGTVSEPQPGRDDWQVAFPEGEAVVEVKGVKKSAAEKHAAQLEKWVAGAYEETGKMPKGLLIVNAWRETPINERTEEDFPAQMLPYSEGRAHCLVSGLQLFLIRAEVEQDPERAAHWRKVLMESKGTITTPGWKSVLQEEHQEAPGEPTETTPATARPDSKPNVG